ncbi:hypothetical protein HK100_003797 [Physocladia obscura]|uniref:Cytochrome P450 n=1 Tax=Physocladia obscura TaxID=109957 RepID=A0AAD5XCZ6_9FUNG|nr:hypothetical protein HK100_003797 [Physocladia obscura]
MPLHNLDLLIVNIDKEMSKPTLDIIGRAGFGYDFQSVKNGLSSQYENVFKKAFESFTLPNAIIDLFFPFLNWIVPHRRKMKRGLAETEAGIREYCREIFETRKKEVLASDESGDNTECKDLLSVLVRGNLAADVQDQLTDEEVMAQIMTFLVAGHETTSVSLTWTFDFLSNNPLTQKKLRQEVLEYLPANADNEYFVEYITSTKTYLDAVCKESLRLVPSAPITSRRTNQDDTLDGYFIPKGTFISIVPGVNHRLPEYWGPDCLEFKPERWLHADSEKVEGIDDIESSGNTAEKSFGAYMPFLLGPRNCIGQRFAMLEMKSILAVLVASFEFEKIEQGVVKKKLTITWKPESGIKIGIKKAVY